MRTATPTEDVIRPIILQTYGDNGVTRAMVVHLAERIDNYDGHYDERGGREHMVMRVCWDWMTGGTTAESVARKIEDALASGQEQGHG